MKIVFGVILICTVTQVILTENQNFPRMSPKRSLHGHTAWKEGEVLYMPSITLGPRDSSYPPTGTHNPSLTPVAGITATSLLTSWLLVSVACTNVRQRVRLHWEIIEKRFGKIQEGRTDYGDRVQGLVRQVY